MSRLNGLRFLVILSLAANSPVGIMATAQNVERVGWTSSPNNRGTIDIVWSCIFTVFICCWTAVHPDIPPPGSSWKYRFADRTLCLLVGTFAPEILVYTAFFERVTARDFQVEQTQSLHQLDPQLSNVHCFYAQMGGFSVRWQDALGVVKPGFLHISTVQTLLEDGRLSYQNFITKKEIEDKGKADSVVKLIALFQIFWVLIQCIARAIQHLPLTTLEISTLAYIPIAVFVFYFWWDKPYEVSEPTVLTVRPTPPLMMNNSDHEKPDKVAETFRSFPIFDYENFRMTRLSTEAVTTCLYPVSRVGFLTGTVFIIFGGIHCAAWNFSFPSEAERWAWRVSSLVLGASIPLSWVLTRIILFLLGLLGERDEIEAVSDIRIKIPKVTWGNRRFMILIKANWVARIVQGAGLVLYMCARLYLLVEVFVSLRSLPAGCYETPDWTMFLPHV